MRRLLALTLLILTSVSSMEAVVGVMRDGEVHHENPGVAAAHAQESAGDHGHEDAASPGEHSHDEGHDHGTASDHCTHTHSAAVLTSSPPPLVFETVEYHFTESVRPHALASDGFVHPPRA
jgi:ABC-type Zn2+ transport system substrate-binding protein/surface adhesin